MILNEALRYPHARTPNHFLAQTIDLSFNQDQPISVYPELIEVPGPNTVRFVMPGSMSLPRTPIRGHPWIAGAATPDSIRGRNDNS